MKEGEFHLLKYIKGVGKPAILVDKKSRGLKDAFHGRKKSRSSFGFVIYLILNEVHSQQFKKGCIVLK